MQKIAFFAALSLIFFAQGCAPNSEKENKTALTNKEAMNNTDQKEHYTFELGDNVTREKVTFKNRYGITLTGDLYLPENRGSEKLAALAISGPYGAVKEQSSGLYANQMAQLGFAVVAFDPSYTGESSGEPRNVASPDIFTEDLSAAIDFLGTLAYEDREKVGIIGICGFGGFALNATAVDKRVKAVAVASMYDMSRVTAKDYDNSLYGVIINVLQHKKQQHEYKRDISERTTGGGEFYR